LIPTVVVVGAGVAGLTTSFEILERAERRPGGVRLRCLEAAPRAGGQIESRREQGFLCEWAANGFLDNAPATVTLVRRLDLEPRLLPAREAAARRFIYRRGRLRAVPLSPGAFVRSDILPLGSKLRLLGEPFVPRRTAAEDESVHAFAARRIGRGAADVLIDAMVAGIFAGDARRLSLAATFPRMAELEARHGSLTRALLARRGRARRAGAGPAGPGGRLHSFIDGMQELTDALARRLGPALELSRPVERLSHLGRRGLRVHPSQGAPIDADAVILACPAPAAARLLEPVDAELHGALAGITLAPVSVVHLGYRGLADSRDDGFGFLVPREQGPRILGCLWSSSIFDWRAAEGTRLITVMAGGARDPAAAGLADGDLLARVRADLAATMKLGAEPSFVRIVRHPRGIAQYELGHTARLATIERCLSRLPGLWIAGSSLHGVSVNLAVERAPAVAEAALEHLARREQVAAP